VARSFVAACLLFAGTWLLASLGWALLAGAFLVFVLWRPEPDWRALQSRAGRLGRDLAGRVKAAPRRVTAVGGMGAGVVLLPAGAGLAAGVGVGLIAAAAALIGLSLLAGQGA
jgi:hypothetical protein